MNTPSPFPVCSTLHCCRYPTFPSLPSADSPSCVFTSYTDPERCAGVSRLHSSVGLRPCLPRRTHFTLVYLVGLLLCSTVWFTTAVTNEETPTLTVSFMVILVESGIPVVDAKMLRSRRARILAVEKNLGPVGFRITTWTTIIHLDPYTQPKPKTGIAQLMGGHWWSCVSFGKWEGHFCLLHWNW